MTIYEFYQLYAAELTLGALAGVILLLIWVIALQWRLSRLHRRYRAAMSATEGGDLEIWLTEQRTAQADQGERLLALEARSRTLEEQIALSAGHVGIVRFNPFQDTGGDQSFAIAWVDDRANGVVMTSLYSRAGVRLYAKPLENGSSSYALTEEEQAAIKAALA